MKVLVTRDLKEKYIEQIRNEVPEYEVVKAADDELQEKEIVDSNILVTFPAAFDLDKIYKAPDLCWIQAWSAGVNSILVDKRLRQHIIDKNIKLTTMSGIHSDVIAEQVMGFMINFSRKLHQCYRQQLARVWKHPRVSQLAGRTIAIVGLGNIGREIAVRAKAFKMKVHGMKRDTSSRVENVDKLFKPEEFPELLAGADYVVVIVPLTAETRGMFGLDQFKMMKESAYFINVARGEIVKESELITALRDKVIAGAGLDVFAEEPLPSDSPLYGMENVLITPHIGGIFPGYNTKAVPLLIENLKRFEEGRELLNLVDYERGY